MQFKTEVSHVERKPKADFYTKNLHVEGQDQAGIVYKVSRFLADSDINISSLNSEVKFSPESGIAIYSMALSVEIPTEISLYIVEDGLSQIGNQLNVDVTID